MSAATRKTLLWSPRILAILAALWLSIFALDAFSENQAFLASVPAFVLHLTPSFMVLGVVFIAWRRPWFGALIFFIFALAFAAGTLEHPVWILAIAGPLGIVALLYGVSWRVQRTTPGTG